MNSLHHEQHPTKMSSNPFGVKLKSVDASKGKRSSSLPDVEDSMAGLDLDLSKQRTSLRKVDISALEGSLNRHSGHLRSDSPSGSSRRRSDVHEDFEQDLSSRRTSLRKITPKEKPNLRPSGKFQKPLWMQVHYVAQPTFGIVLRRGSASKRDSLQKMPKIVEQLEDEDDELEEEKEKMAVAAQRKDEFAYLDLNFPIPEENEDDDESDNGEEEKEEESEKEANEIPASDKPNGNKKPRRDTLFGVRLKPTAASLRSGKQNSGFVQTYQIDLPKDEALTESSLAKNRPDPGAFKVGRSYLEIKLKPCRIQLPAIPEATVEDEEDDENEDEEEKEEIPNQDATNPVDQVVEELKENSSNPDDAHSLLHSKEKPFMVEMKLRHVMVPEDRGKLQVATETALTIPLRTTPTQVLQEQQSLQSAGKEYEEPATLYQLEFNMLRDQIEQVLKNTSGHGDGDNGDGEANGATNGAGSGDPNSSNGSNNNGDEFVNVLLHLRHVDPFTGKAMYDIDSNNTIEIQLRKTPYPLERGDGGPRGVFPPSMQVKLRKTPPPQKLHPEEKYPHDVDLRPAPSPQKRQSLDGSWSHGIQLKAIETIQEEQEDEADWGDEEGMMNESIRTADLMNDSPTKGSAGMSDSMPAMMFGKERLTMEDDSMPDLSSNSADDKDNNNIAPGDNVPTRHSMSDLSFNEEHDYLLKKKEFQELKLKEIQERPAKPPVTQLSEKKRRDLLMWYTRMQTPTKAEMKRRVAKLPPSCDITPEDVELLPWICRDRMLDIRAMNKLFLEDWQGAPDKQKDDNDSGSDDE